MLFQRPFGNRFILFCAAFAMGVLPINMKFGNGTGTRLSKRYTHGTGSGESYRSGTGIDSLTGIESGTRTLDFLFTFVRLFHCNLYGAILYILPINMKFEIEPELDYQKDIFTEHDQVKVTELEQE